MKFKTLTGSIYVINFWTREIQKLNSSDGRKKYFSVNVPKVGGKVLVVWNNGGQDIMVTSTVVEILEETEQDRSFFSTVVQVASSGVDTLVS